jgi:hypothetical protein
MEKFGTLKELVEAMKREEIPSDVVSPGAAADVLGITRSSVHSRLLRGSLRAWSAEGVILIDTKSLLAAVKEKRGVPEGQGELNVTT